MSDVAKMRRLLGREDELASLTEDEMAVLVDGHSESISNESASQLQTLETALSAVDAEREASKPERTGRAVLRTLRAIGQSSMPAPAIVSELAGLLTTCSSLGPPRFRFQSRDAVTRNDNGNVVTFSRARASARTLELSAVVGEFGLVRWPSSETFIFGWNRSQASIGGLLRIPAHGEGTLLTVSVQLRVENVQFDGSVTLGTASNLLQPIQGDGNLPLRGGALGWCNAGLSLHGATGSARTTLQFVSEWVNRDGADSLDRAPGGVFTLSNTVALGPSTSLLSIVVDAEAFAGAEESEQLLGGFTAFECRVRPVQEVNGIWLPPARLHVARVDALLCEIPVLKESPGKARA